MTDQTYQEAKAAIDPSLFKVDQREGQYTVRVRVEGNIEIELTAESEEAAKAEVQQMIDDDHDDLAELEDVVYASIRCVTKKPPMYLVVRNGQKMRTSHLEPGDLPREPDDRGF
jgi:hypothetical protein